jgi:hypothetical protein
VGEEECRALLEGAGGGVMQDAQQHKGDQRDIDLGAHGVFAATEKAADVEVLLEPFEQQFDVPALLVEPGDVDGRVLQVVGERVKRLLVIGPGYGAVVRALRAGAATGAQVDEASQI